MAIEILELATSTDDSISSGQFIFISRLLFPDIVYKCHAELASDPEIFKELEKHKIFQLAAKKFRPPTDAIFPGASSIEPMLWSVAAKLQNSTSFIPQIFNHPVFTTSYPSCCYNTQDDFGRKLPTFDLLVKTTCTFIEDNLTEISAYTYFDHYNKTCPMRLYTNIKNEGYTGK